MRPASWATRQRARIRTNQPFIEGQTMSSEMGKRFAAAVAVAGMLIVTNAARSETLDLTQLVGGNLPSGFLSTDSTTGQTLYASFGIQTSGTGVINPFLTIQATGTEQGYNTSQGNPSMDDKFGNDG